MNEVSKGYDNDTLNKLHNVELEIINDLAKICEENHLRYFLAYGTLLGCVRHQGFIPWDDDVDVAMPREDLNKLITIMKDHPKYKILNPNIDPRYASGVTHFQKKGTKFISNNSRHLTCDLCIDIDIFECDKISKNPKVRKKQLRNTYYARKMLYLIGTPHPYIPLSGLKKFLAATVCFFGHYALKLCGFTAVKLYNIYTKNASLSSNADDFDYCLFGDFKDESAVITQEQLYPLKKSQFENYEFFIPNDSDSILKGVYGDYMRIPDKDQQINHCPYFIDFGEE